MQEPAEKNVKIILNMPQPGFEDLELQPVVSEAQQYTDDTVYSLHPANCSQPSHFEDSVGVYIYRINTPTHQKMKLFLPSLECQKGAKCFRV